MIHVLRKPRFPRICPFCDHPIGWFRGRVVPLAYDLEGDWDCVGCRWLRVLIRTYGPGMIYHSRCMDRDYEHFKLAESPRRPDLARARTSKSREEVRNAC